MAEEVPLRLPINALVSYHYFGEEDIAEMARWGLRLIGDSGAFSAMSLGAPISLDSFEGWAHRWKDSLCWVASLDAIGDVGQSWENFRSLRKSGLEVVPTLHFGDDPSELNRYFDDGVDFVGLGGMVPYKSEPDRLLRWCLSMFLHARDNFPSMRFHGWGVTHTRLIQSLPWYSVDSSGFSTAYRFARLSLFDPRLSKLVAIDLDGRDVYRYSELIRDIYGTDPALIAISNSSTRRAVARIAIAGVQRLEDFVRARHGEISMPTYGVRSGGGSNVHISLGFPSSQATKGVSPYDDEPPRATISDEGPHLHIATSTIADYRLATNQGELS